MPPDDPESQHQQQHKYLASSSSSSSSKSSSHPTYDDDDNDANATRNHAAAATSAASITTTTNLAAAAAEENPPSTLSSREIRSLLFLLLLYFVPAIPVTFSWMSMPILLRQQLDYGHVATFILAQYPFSLKAFWAPLVDGFHLPPPVGRRKTWMVPGLLLGGGVLCWLGVWQDGIIAGIAAAAEEEGMKNGMEAGGGGGGGGGGKGMGWLVTAWVLLMGLCATVKVSVDSWALDGKLLREENVHWGASTMGSVGEACGGVVSFTAFMGVAFLNTPEGEAASTRGFFLGTAGVFVATAVGLLVWAREEEEEEERREGKKEGGVKEAYTIFGRILRLRHVWKLMGVHVLSMVGFITNDTITVLQLVKNNFDDLELAGLGTATVPFATAAGFLIARALRTRHPLRVWRELFGWRLGMAFVSQLTVLFCAKYPDSGFWRWLIVFLPYVLSRSLENAMWVTFVAFHAQVSDPQYGGMYMSLLATTLNVRYDLLQFLFTKLIGAIDGGEVDEEGLTQSAQLIDGYQIVNLVAVVLAVPIYRFFLKPVTLCLQAIDISAWRIKHSGNFGGGSYELVGRDED